MKVAIVHDWLTGMRGGEKVLEVLCELFPQAEIFTLVYNEDAISPIIRQHRVHPSFLQSFPLITEQYRNYLPLFPVGIESFNLKEFDLVISSSHCVAKAARKRKSATHICYCHTPMRYVWNFFDQYFGSYPAWQKSLIKFFVNDLKRWDKATTGRVDEFIANSETVKSRIWDIYRRHATVINPPVDIERFTFDGNRKRRDFYLCVSACVAYKRLDIIVDAFNTMPEKRILIVGDGDRRRELQARASKNITFSGWVECDELVTLYQEARAFIYAAEEDFGIAPLEAQATGAPVIAFGRGGVSETIVPLNGALRNSNPTGLFFFQQDAEAVIEAVVEFERRTHEFSAQTIRENALRFSRENFKERMQQYILEHVNAHRLS